jgi:hypothetical protein
VAPSNASTAPGNRGVLFSRIERLRFGAVLLDLDGCLIDSNDAHARAWSRALRAFGLRVRPSAIRIHIGKGAPSCYEIFFLRLPTIS